tara:strand:+ start:244 stop:522 length:279 start_codon:yes stop_codon:yes gene_type:complete
MIKVWFLMALMSYPNTNAVHYKGYGGFNSQEGCEEKKVMVENMVVEVEIARGTPSFYVETYCMEMYAFPSQFNAPRKNPPENSPVDPSEFGV